ncbi:MAG: hypothetical protein ACK5NT_07415 [Pyrinomonadaceae bacterium]
MNKFEYDVAFKKGPIDDIFTMEYINESLSIIAYVNDDLVTSYEFVPNNVDKVEKSFPCQLGIVAVNELPDMWIERFWDISNSQMKSTAKYVKRSLLNQAIKSEIYIAFSYRNPEERLDAICRSFRTKEALAEVGIELSLIFVIDLGQESVSEITIHIGYQGQIEMANRELRNESKCSSVSKLILK